MVATGDEIRASDFTALEDLTIRRPRCRVVQSTIQSIPDNTATAITFTTEDDDPLGFHDTVTNTTRITPTIAGWYRCTGTYFSATLAASTPGLHAVFFRKNGATSIPPGKRSLNQSIVVSPGVSCTTQIQFNGTTDYIELMALQDSTGAVNTAVSAYIACAIDCVYEYNS